MEAIAIRNLSRKQPKTNLIHGHQNFKKWKVKSAGGLGNAEACPKAAALFKAGKLLKKERLKLLERLY